VAIIFFYLNSRIKKEHKKGLVFFEYICFYSFFRFFTEFLRGDLSRGFVLNGMLSHAQFIAIILCSIFGFLIFKINRSNLL
jgi:phosphatidylglycerol:prolipoprotein diacylglycerol transferase